ncbi:MAG: RluA family pseudouridine synthase [Gammaproteobacteria bacterium]|nr:RluA family pseudouridine synthase [Gammaproteobacteria bacterium]MYF01694.1 RluA family pseudouridine synthase [Gammaproteobacteria bacterium]MYI76550.1 RluA family pseudouridine synthase [Gammaproteobacteria bacterium]
MKTEHIERELTIPTECVGLRLDRTLAMLWPDLSRATIHKWILDKSLQVNGVDSKPSYRVRGREHVRVHALLSAGLDWESKEEVPFKILHEDEHLLVVEKPAGVVTHPGPGNETNTLVNGLISHREELVQLPRAGIVHRLDRDTSGILLVAASAIACTKLTELIARREVCRLYVCVMEGLMEQVTVVDLAIGRHVKTRTKQQVRQDGKPARTEFRPLEQFRSHTYAQARLDTGRTHQIRVHASSLSVPLVGDVTYGAKGRLPSTPLPELVDAIRGFTRQALHAKSLEFKHPIFETELRFTSAIPEDMQALLEVLRRDNVEFLGD